MVCALKAVGATVKYSLLKGAPHNLPPDFDQQAVVSWYLQQTRSHLPPPRDPLDALGLGTSGFSETIMITLPGGWFGKSPTAPWQAGQNRRSSSSGLERALFSKVEDRGALVDNPVREEIDPQKQTRTLWLMIPDSIRSQDENDTSVAKLPERKAARFYGRGDAGTMLAHAATISAKFKNEGKLLSDTVWITPLTSSRRDSNNINECWIELR